MMLWFLAGVCSAVIGLYMVVYGLAKFFGDADE